MKANPVGWFELYVDDMQRAQRFYEAVFQTKLQSLPSPQIEMMAFPMDPETTGCAGAIVKAPGVKPGGSTMVYFTCDDCAVEAARVTEAGGSISRPKMSIGEYGYIALVVDTEGNMFGLHSNK
ncbi:VOC family protein [Pelagicoccus sp. SDUM812003]|uniref:VOC family protein n=1 Tax=Pelagicoccus sp. SDUM812003 TaxID=3041267 RepID=UPI0028106919|nr:VOC family protein [Pelagicoccus sp. SDUM812003]MDQ8203200.1 VOC family protein [Pelagicoccus sp. SDUM812003]